MPRLGDFEVPLSGTSRFCSHVAEGPPLQSTTQREEGPCHQVLQFEPDEFPISVNVRTWDGRDDFELEASFSFSEWRTPSIWRSPIR